VSVKIEFKAQELAHREKLVSQLAKVKAFYEKNFLS
jgi:hypothetical protein